MNTRTMTALDEILEGLGVDADRLASQAVVGVPDLDPAIAYLISQPGALPAEIVDEHAAMRAAADEIESVREEAVTLGQDAKAEVRAYRAALVEGAKDRSKLPKATPDLEPFRVRMDALSIAYGAAQSALVVATVALNAKADAVRWVALTRARAAFERKVAEYDAAVGAFRQAFDEMDGAEVQALALDPVLAHRIDVVNRYSQGFAHLRASRDAVRFALDTSASAAAFSPTSVALLTRDGWLRGEHRVAFERMAPEPIPVEPSPIPHEDDAADDVALGYVPDETEWDRDWLNGKPGEAAIVEKVRARRKSKSDEPVAVDES